jgi:hypothetical protein
LRDRRADLKKKAAKIAGNMCALVADPKDMSPYVPLLLPDIQKSLIDPIPEVRATAASALASLIRGMGGVDEHFSDLIPWLTETLQSDGPMTERSGAAQGLAECLAVLGSEHFEAMLPEILAGCHHVAPHVREGHLTLLRFLPLALGHLFEPHLQEALAEVLTGLADQVESVRDAALAAGRVFVEEFSHSAQSLDLLLPSIEDGITATNWRIRQSATELMGSMMFRIAGTSGKVLNLEGGSDDEGISTEAQGRALTSTLGEQRHHDLLAAVYSLRSDPVFGRFATPLFTSGKPSWPTRRGRCVWSSRGSCRGSSPVSARTTMTGGRPRAGAWASSCASSASACSAKCFPSLAKGWRTPTRRRARACASASPRCSAPRGRRTWSSTSRMSFRSSGTPSATKRRV